MTLFRLTFLCLILVGCQSTDSASPDETQKNLAVKPIVTNVPVEKHVWLTDENCVSFLTEYGNQHAENEIVIHTELGDIEIELFQETPLHRANMIYLVKEKKYFDGTYFYRVVKDFIAQGGNNDQENIQQRRFLIGKYTIPAEMNDQFYHRTGAVAMARSYEDNPEKRSSPYDFYIIIGQKQSDFGLDMTEKEYGIRLSPAQREVYMETGGSPHLDGSHTIIGRVTKGLDVAIAIGKQKTDGSDWPEENIPITIRLKP